MVSHSRFGQRAFGFDGTPRDAFRPFLVAVLLCGVVVVRLVDEERYLSQHLSGYDAYRRNVRYRLIPHVW